MSDVAPSKKALFERARLSKWLVHHAPAWTASPTSPRELREVLRDAQAKGVALWPLGAGMHVVLPTQAVPTYAILDTTGIHRVEAIDRSSMMVCVEAGCTVGALEEALSTEDLTVQHLGRLPERATIGGLLSRRSTWSAPFGVPDVRAACVGLTVQIDAERTYTYAPAPRKATGPDLRALFLGGQGRGGVITRVWLVVARRWQREVTYAMPNIDVAVRAAREIVASGVRPWAFELRAYPEAVDLWVRLGGDPSLVEAWRNTVARVVEGAGGSLSEQKVPTWELGGVAADEVRVAGAWGVVLAGVKHALEHGYRANVYGANAWGALVRFSEVSIASEVGRELVRLPWGADESPGHALSGSALPAVARRLAASLDPSSLWFREADVGPHPATGEVLP